MKKLLLFIITVIAIENQVAAQSFSVSKIPSIPEDMSGCGCTFSLNKADFSKDSFIYRDNSSEAIMYIDGALTKFEFKQHPSSIEVGSGKTIRINNDQYEISIKTQTIGRGYESFLKKGSMIIRNKATGKKRELLVYGLCGC